MSPAAEQVYRSVLSLSEPERRELMDVLLAEGDADPEHPFHSLWQAEVQHRGAEVEGGTARLSPWSEVKGRVRQNLGMESDG